MPEMACRLVAPRLAVQVARGVLLAFSLVLALASAPASADITLSLDFKDGDHIADVVKVVAHADSPDGINLVAFKVDDRAPYTHDSVPYVYNWDTIKDTEGPHSLTVTATDTKGGTKTVKVDLVIDNELSQGAPVLAQKGLDALAARDLDTATRYSRRSLKAEPGNIAAVRLQGAIAAYRKDWEAAVTAFDGAKGLDTNVAALQELASYRLARAMQPGSAVDFFGEIQSAETLRHKAADLVVAQVMEANKPASGKPTVDNDIAIGDALMNAARYKEALAYYGHNALANDAPVPLVNRYGLAEIMDDRPADVEAILRPLMITNRADAVTRAVYGLALLRRQRFTEARSAVEQDVANQVPAALVIAAYADMSLGKRHDAQNEAHDAITQTKGAAEANYALALAAGTVDEQEPPLARAIGQALFQPGPLLFYAANSAAMRKQEKYDLALNLTDLALTQDPGNLNARITQVLVYLQTQQVKKAEVILADLYKNFRHEPDVAMTMAVYWNVKGDAALVRQYMNEARMLDPKQFDFQVIQDPIMYLSTLNRRLHYRPDPFLSVGTLYPPAN